MPFLFSEYAANVIRDPDPKPNDLYQSYLCIGISNLVLKFSKWRDENYAIDISPCHSVRETFDLYDAVRAVNPGQKPLDRFADVRWSLWRPLLQSNLDLLIGAFQEETFPATREKITEVRNRKL